MSPSRIAVLISGTGRSLENLLRVCAAGELDAEVGLVVADRGKLRGLEIAEAASVPTQVIRPRDCDGPEDFSAQVFDAVEAAACGTVVLAGFLRHLPIPAGWLGRVLNIHPSLLPAHGGKGFWGDHVHRSVLEAGDAVTGCTVHYVDNVFDAGPIILQRRVDVRPDDDVHSLAGRVFDEECIALPEALRQHLAGEVRFVAGRVVRGDG
ncbi:phosphoribosylglycinamide formyltransferase [Engelhardtia mirabilis]|uniref:Phosphoribosylglycinamide formyltransferase n=1 Tax=Engelhardtia mirabilis TaxID=2528011 RepID=A0A518BJR8_9BACT|nr:Phosphoribosylglycinamide formyltransferase [Planctomycetes bacterium Pla133]QDV01549.1 Phosphoribosylglycinamide formyltransferase [Planctomycetes bacterium Pla86]